MAIVGLDYFYDAQMRRFLMQVVRAFSGFQYKTGRKNDEEPQLRMVPCRMASTNRLVGHIMRNNSENTLLSVPMLTVWQTGLSMARDRLQNPTHIDTRSVHERKIDLVTGEYTAEAGNRYTVKRLMPRPFDMTIQVDLWTSNLDQKHQLTEQILTVFYPDIQIQNDENPLDWTARTTFELTDMQFSSQSIPIGSDDSIDIATFNFKLPMWISPPAQVTEERVIHQVIANIHEGDNTDGISVDNRVSQVIVTPGNHRVEVNVRDGTLKLLGAKGAERDKDNNIYRWDDLLVQYGSLRPTISEVRLKRDIDIESTNEVVGTIQIDSQHPNILFWQIDPDTLPSNTLAPITGIINPLETYPGNGITATSGARYLVLADIGSVGNTTTAWGGLVARENDIIAYSGGVWSVSFDASTVNNVQHVLNLYSSTQFRWTGSEWVTAIGGDYGPGYWRLNL